MIELHPIGTIHSPHTELEGMPIQPSGAAGIPGTVEIYDEFVSGLKDLEGFSHIILLYHFHKSRDYKLEVTPFLDSIPRGLFATRAPRRPNPIGISVVQLDKIENNILHIRNVDILDGTPLIDIKPYVPEFDSAAQVRIGWLEQAARRAERHKADNRFQE